MTDFKFDLEEPQKVVDYFGIKLVVSDSAMSVFCDDYGNIFESTSNKMELVNIDCKLEWWDKTKCFSTSRLGKLKSMPRQDWWKESLIEV